MKPLQIIAAIGILLLVLARLSGCGSSGSGDQESGAPAEFPPAAPAAVVVDSVRFIDTIETHPLVTMTDCGYSARIGDKSVWVFGDSFVTLPNEDNQYVLCNSWSYTYDIDAADGLAGFSGRVDAVGAPTPLIPLTSEEKAYNELHAGENCVEEPCGAMWAIWPGAIIANPEGPEAYVFYHKIHVLPGFMNFSHVGHSVAVWDNFAKSAERPHFNLFEDLPTLLFSSDDQQIREGFGSAAILVEDHFYIYGCEFIDAIWESPCRLARVPFDRILDPPAWAYYTFHGDWSAELEQSALLFGGSNMMTVFHIERIGVFAAVYSKPLTNDVMLRTAPRPWGPWSEEIHLFSTELPQRDPSWVYDAMAHPEFSTNEGMTLYITYSRALGESLSEMRLVEVNLATAP